MRVQLRVRTPSNPKQNTAQATNIAIARSDARANSAILRVLESWGTGGGLLFFWVLELRGQFKGRGGGP